jgi:branched-chain amino acid transport system substrate-binding protein
MRIKRIKYRLVIVSMALLSAALILSPAMIACTPQAPQQAGPIKIGLLGEQTGPMAFLTKTMFWGIEIPFDDVGWQVAGRPVEMITEDTENTPEGGLTKARKLVERDKVDLLEGVINSGVGLAIRDYVDTAKVPWVATMVATSVLTREKYSDYVFRSSWSGGGQMGRPMAAYAYKTLGYRNITILASDYAMGRDSGAEFKAAFEEMGGKIVDELWAPLGTSDFAPYLTRIKDTDAVYLWVTGSDVQPVLRQYAEYGLKERIPIITSTDSVVTTSDVNALGDITVGIIYTNNYAPTIDTPENKAFIQAYEAKANMEPYSMVSSGYYGSRLIVEALKATKGNTDVPKLIKALSEVKFTSLTGGTWRLDAKHNPIFDVYIMKIEKENGQYVRTRIETIKNVDQDWDVKEY